MSFINNLVARNLGSVAAIRPRLTSLFEPVRGNLASLRDPAVAQSVAAAVEETETEVTGPHEVSPNESSALPAPRRRKPRKIAPVADDPDDDSAEPEAMTPPLETRQVARRAAPLRKSRPRTATNPDGSGSSGPEHEGSSPDLESSEADRSELRREPDATLRVPRAIRARGGLLNAEIPQTHQTPPPVEEHVFHTQPASGNLSLPANGREPFAGGKPAQQLLVAPAPPPVNDGRMLDGLRSARLGGDRRDQMFPAKREQAEPEPIIEVTIGRIEIRAETTGASTRKAERAASPVMGLEEYLRRRSNRGNA